MCFFQKIFLRRGVGIPLTGLTLPNFCACPKPGPGFPLIWPGLFYVQWVEMRDACLFCWYRWTITVLTFFPYLYNQKVAKNVVIHKIYQWYKMLYDVCFSQSTLVSSTNKTDCHDITEILLKVALNTINLNLYDVCCIRIA